MRLLAVAVSYTHLETEKVTNDSGTDDTAQETFPCLVRAYFRKNLMPSEKFAPDKLHDVIAVSYTHLSMKLALRFDDLFREYDYIVGPSASCVAFVKENHPGILEKEDVYKRQV